MKRSIAVLSLTVLVVLTFVALVPVTPAEAQWYPIPFQGPMYHPRPVVVSRSVYVRQGGGSDAAQWASVGLGAINVGLNAWQLKELYDIQAKQEAAARQAAQPTVVYTSQPQVQQAPAAPVLQQSTEPACKGLLPKDEEECWKAVHKAVQQGYEQHKAGVIARSENAAREAARSGQVLPKENRTW
mgnify:CR=1 FL=1